MFSEKAVFNADSDGKTCATDKKKKIEKKENNKKNI